jgi:hypothetical protein
LLANVVTNTGCRRHCRVSQPLPPENTVSRPITVRNVRPLTTAICGWRSRGALRYQTHVHCARQSR